MITHVGRHAVRVGSIMDDLEGLIPVGGVDYFYSDPPWGDGNLKFWQTMNVKNTGAQRRDVPLYDFLRRFFFILKEASKPTTVVFVEYGLRWRQAIEDCARYIGLKVLAVSTPVYGKPARPLNLFTMAYQPIDLPVDYVRSVDGTTSMSTLFAATGPFDLAGKTILDPCCGLGNTARLAVQRGMTFYGNELNAKRAAETVKVLQ